MARGQGTGVVVGPGSTHPTVFAQTINVKPGEQFTVMARASSVDDSESLGAIQINWLTSRGTFVGVSQKYFKVGQAEKAFEHSVTAPRDAALGILYVVPGGPAHAVRYTEMALIRLEPLHDFMSYRFLGIKGQDAMVLFAASALLVGFFALFGKRLSAAATALASGVVRFFPVVATLLCAGMFFFLEGPYEQHYDAHWHQASVESVMQWKELYPWLGGSPLHNFGIQHVINPQLSPTFLLGSLMPADHRIPLQAALQALLMFAILTQICRRSGIAAADASAISLMAVGFLWIPILSDHAITLNATLGLLWQEGALATLVAFFCFAHIGQGNSRVLHDLYWTLGLAATILWLALAFPEIIPFFTLATAGLCAGALIGSNSGSEFRKKAAAGTAVIAGLLLIGFHHYVLNLFLYTPQLYFKTLYNHDFKSLFFTNTSLLLSSSKLGGEKVIVFFILAAIGAVFALRQGNTFARVVVFGGLGMEAAIHLFSALNRALRIVPLTFIYIEQMGLAIVALLAATGAWALLHLASQAIAVSENLVRSRKWRSGPL